jgi:hypothetical protein
MKKEFYFYLNLLIYTIVLIIIIKKLDLAPYAGLYILIFGIIFIAYILTLIFHRE